jgi:hypothetical protein
MLTREHKWTFGDAETLVYVAAVSLGVPLTMLELWNLGRTTLVAGLACLWIPTVSMLIADVLKGQVSRVSVALFLVWVAVVIGSGIYAYVV